MTCARVPFEEREWRTLFTRKESNPTEAPVEAQRRVQQTVADMIEAIRDRGVEAVREYSAKLDGWEPESFRLTPEQIDELVAGVPAQVIEDITFCQTQIRTFAEAQRASLTDVEIETIPGVTLGHRHVPVQNVGSYVPGGRYPMVASAHMSVVTAKVAGVERVVSCTPPMNGAPPPVTVAAMHLAGADEVHVVGGVQAIASLALGTDAMERVDLVVGPGNAYVAEAKRQLFGEIGIDLPAGPTEILVIADEHADPVIVAADLLGQAEHGPTSAAVLITTSDGLATVVLEEVDRQLEVLPTADVAAVSWRDYGEIRVVASMDEAVDEANRLAFEHVEVLTQEPRYFLERLRNYGSLFLGEETTVAYGDKTIGTNHILPTAGAARYTGGLWVGKFLKTVTYQAATREASVQIGEVCARQCRIENFEGHARTCDVRVEKFSAVPAA
jgi:sulfopropanediol 3-dehydrogenase